MDNVFAAVLTGTSPYAADDFSKAIAERFEAIKDSEAFVPRDHTHPTSHGMGFCYDGNRCRAENLGWRPIAHGRHRAVRSAFRVSTTARPVRNSLVRLKFSPQ